MDTDLANLKKTLQTQLDQIREKRQELEHQTLNK
jgi:hypothetical protein